MRAEGQGGAQGQAALAEQYQLVSQQWDTENCQEMLMFLTRVSHSIRGDRRVRPAPVEQIRSTSAGSADGQQLRCAWFLRNMLVG